MLTSQTWQSEVMSASTYDDAIRKGDTFFASRSKGKGSGFKQYMRWKINMENYWGPNNKLVNRSMVNYQTYSSLQKLIPQHRHSHGQWENLGPFDYSGHSSWSQGGIGRINCMAFHPSNPQIFWVGTPAGGVWKTNNGGNSWQPISDGFSSIGISGIAVHPQDPNIIYVLTGDGDGSDTPSIGVLKTTDGGLHWKQTYPAFAVDSPLVYGYTINIHPTHPDTLWVGMKTKGIYVTTDGGNWWTQKVDSTTVWDIEYVPNSPDTVYAASTNGLLRSVNGGVTWISIDDPNFPNSYVRMAIAVSPDEPSNIYALFGGATGMNGTFKGLFKSTDYGSTFNMQSNSPCILDPTMSGNAMDNQSGYDLALAVDPIDDNRIFVGAINTWKSENSGTTWSRETWWTRQNHPVDPYVHADFHNLYFQDDILFAVNDGGIYKTADLGNSWTELSAGLALMMFYEIDVLNTSWMGGSQDNGTCESDVSDPQADHIEGGDGFGAVWHTGDNSIQYLSTQNSLIRRQFGSNIYIWQDDGGFWDIDIMMHSTDPNYFFFCKGGELFRGNQNTGPTDFNFDSLGATPHVTPYRIRDFIQGSDISNDTMYVISRNVILRSDNINDVNPTWEVLPNPTFEDVYLSSVMISPDNARKVWISCSNHDEDLKVFYSDDAGESWSNITGVLPNIPTLTMAYAPGTADGIYLGTDIGVFYKDTILSNWVYYSNLLPNVPVRDILVYNGYVYAGTYGRGIWRSMLHTCQSDLVLTPANDPSDPLNMGHQEYSAGQTITSTRIIQSTNADIHYRAGNFIDLKPGFWIKDGSRMRTYNDGCPD